MSPLTSFGACRFFTLSLTLLGCGRVGVELSDLPTWSLLDSSVSAIDADLPDVASPLDAAMPPDAGALDATPACESDLDRDGVCDGDDNCPQAPNAAQLDGNRDGVGDACDADGDGLPDLTDRCPSDALNDSDGDGVCDGVDGCPMDPTKSVAGPCGCDRSAPLGLAAYWPFDETAGVIASDAVAGRMGSLHHFASSGAWLAGQVGGALAFDGIDDRVELGNVSTEVRALAFWLSASALAAPTTETPWLSPTAHGSPTAGWREPEGAYAPGDRRYANGGLLNGVTHDWSGFGVRLPGDLAVAGLEAQVWLDTENPTATFDIRVSWDGGVTYSAWRRGPVWVAPIDQYFTFGGAADLWERAGWTVSELQSGSFRLQLSKQGAQGSPMTDGVDHIQVKVHHAMALVNRTLLALGGGASVELSTDSLVLNGFPAGSAFTIDGVAGAKLDAGWHHVVIEAPSAVAASNVQLGAHSDAAYAVPGLIDELKLFTQPLQPADVTTLRSLPACR